MKIQGPFESLMVDFRVYLQSVLDNKKTQQDYLSYVKTLHKNNDGKTLEWLNVALRSNNPIESLKDSFDDYFKGVQPNSQWKTGLVYLGKCVCGHTSAVANLNAIRNFDLIACQLVAQSAIFCSVEVFKQVQDGELGSEDNKKGKGNQEGAWYHHTKRRAHPKDKCGTTVNNIYLDDNTYANKAIKTAVLKGLKTNKQYGSLYIGAKFTGYESCHIWDKTCYDERYHTSVGNLVLLPRTIASLTDHCDEVKKLLKYEAWIRFGFKPQGEAEPQKPKYYKDIVWKYKPQDTKYTLTNLQGDIISKLGKGKLSYEIIKSYIKYKKNCTCENVQETFDNIINKGELKIVRENNLSEDDKRRIRYFKEPLQCSDCEVIVCNQWGEGNIDKMKERAIRLGMTIE